MKKVQNVVKLYTGFHLVMIRGITMALITHGRFVSIFDIINWKWLNHVEFDDEITLLFRHYKTKDDRYQTILLKNGGVYFSVLDYDTNEEMVDTDNRNIKIDGKVIRWGEDIENNQTLYVICNVNGNTVLKVIFRGKISKLETIKDPQPNLNITCL